MSTVSIAWMTPFFAWMSAVTTVLSSTFSPPPATGVNVTFSPSSVVAEPAAAAAPEETRPLTTW